ncbi:MAG: Hsp20/alpha crystallin family protein [Planctomycetota bacterium]|nr:MAG: Hsp20/alpha crystallin family protein [Planctomycetota bacterium]
MTMSTTDIQKSETQQVTRMSNGRRTYVPPVSIYETGDKLVLTADVPGATADDIDIQVEQRELRIHARIADRMPADAKPLLTEYGVGDFRRSFLLGEDIDADSIDAKVEHGVLTLTLPKTEAMRTRHIPVKAVD